MRLHLGTVISGTLRKSDLLRAFAHELALHAHGNNTQLINDAIFWEYAAEDDKFVDIIDDLLDQLNTKLNELAPAGYYFGSHPDDGADFGVWAIEDMQELMAGYDEWLQEQNNKEQEQEGECS